MAHCVPEDVDCLMQSQISKSSSDDDIFIELVRSRPWLYNLNDKNYHDKTMRSNAWRDIAIALHDTADNCAHRWTQLKAIYFKEKSSRERETRSGSAQTKRTPWKLYDKMRELLHGSGNLQRMTISNVCNEASRKITKPCIKSKDSKRKNKEDEFIDTLIHDVQSTISNILDESSKKNDQENASWDTDKLFGQLFTAELSALDEKSLKIKSKEIMNYLSNLDD